MSNGEDLRPPGDQPESLSQPEASTEAGPESPAQNASDAPGPGGFVERAINVITDPVGFYRSMPKSGGYADPLIFMIVLSVTSGLITAVIAAFGIGVRGAVIGGFGAIVLVPIMATIGSFIAAAIFFVIWKVMGSDENYETAYRCVAYSSAIGPVLTLIGMIPAIGSIASAVWPMGLMAIASIQVHKRAEKTSWSVFGALALFLIVINLGTERATDDMTRELEAMQELMEQRDPQ